MRINQLLLLLFLMSTFSSCVSYRKYEDLLLSKGSVELSNDELKQKEQLASSRNLKYEADLREVTNQNVVLKADLERLQLQYKTLDETNRDLLMRYDRMLAQNEQVIATSSSEKANLTERLSKKEHELDKRERELQDLEAEIKKKEGELAKKESDVGQLKGDLSAREKRVKELEAAIAEKDAKLTALREKVNKALLGFSATDLTVREENGKVYVSLSQNLLFKSGSKYINSEGKDAIRKLGTVLSSNPDIAIMVEGHTDTDGDAKSNWELSTGRANSVVQILVDSGIQPQRVTAAGRGEHFPIATNDTSEGKAQNRRTEIILTPKLDDLFDILKN